MAIDIGYVTPYPMSSLFVALPAGPPLDASFLDGCADWVEHYRMEQFDPPDFPRLRIDEYDLCFESEPDWADVVPRALRRATLAGATVAFFLFEGAFSYEHLLTLPEYTFGVAWGGSVECELGDARRRPEWAAVVASARAALEPLLR